jgi:hypothetical protein
VVAGSDHIRKLALDAANVPPTQAGFLLLRFAETVHALQDSWSHQGVPDLPRPLEGALVCDPSLAWAHPRSRGGWNSHKADLTYEWPADTVAMAKATYEALIQYPPISGVKRSPKDWTEIRPLLDGFVRAATKTEKKKWFLAQGITDVSFLAGITLPDGAEMVDLHWGGHRLPRLSTLQSTQHRVNPELLDFYSRFFTRWISSDDFDGLAAAFGAPQPQRPGGNSRSAAMVNAELAARLRVWRIRDHGRVADLAHAANPYTASQRNLISSIAKNGKALARYASPTDAFFPLEVKGPEAQPLLGFVIGMIDASSAGNERAVAMTKLRDAPYDTLVLLAERMEGGWRIVSLGAIVDH